MTLAAVAPAVARVDYKPLPDSELLVPVDYSADGSKAVRELGVIYTPVRKAVEEFIASHRT